MSNRATLKDIATRANVSLTTVSLFLNGNTHVCSVETAERIREAVETLGYHRSPRAVAVGVSGGSATGYAVDTLGENGSAADPGTAPPVTGLPFVPRRTRSRTIGVAVSQAHELYSPDEPTESGVTEALWHGAQQMAEWEEYGLMSFPARIRSGADFRPFLENGLAGLILSSGQNDPRPARLAEAGVPVMLLGRYLDIPESCGAVYALETDTVELAMQHLWNKAHRRIAHYAGPVESTTASQALADEETGKISYVPSDVAIRRRDRYRLWMRKNDLYDSALEFSGEESWKGEHAGIALDTWMALPQPPTAVFCASDSLAHALMAAAQERGIAIPEQLSIIGVDDAGGGPAAADNGHDLPGLTSVSIPVEQIGREAVRLLLRMVDGVPASQCRVAIPVTRIIEGESTADR